MTLKQKLHLKGSQIIVAPAPYQVAPWARAMPRPQQLEAGGTQDEELCTNMGQRWDLSVFLTISLGMF